MRMRWLGLIIALMLILLVLVDAFEAVILPRRVKHGYRLAPVYYRSLWFMWRRLSRLLPAGRWRNGLLSVFGPMSLFGLLSVWACGLITGFGMLNWCLATRLSFPGQTGGTFIDYLYFSGTTFFTLGYGDIVPQYALGRAFSVAEAGIGFAFLAIVISYLPVLYGSFSRREISISLLDARAGSPPTAGELLKRLGNARKLEAAGPLLIEWENWSAGLLESHLSYPVVCYYRSQHDNQSWVGALTTILDTSALMISAVESDLGYQARLTFAMARHAAVDLCLLFRLPPSSPHPDRLSAADFDRLRSSLCATGLKIADEPAVASSLAELRGLYEPFLGSLANHFELIMPPFQPDQPPVDNWQTSPWTQRSPGLSNLPGGILDQASGYDDVH